MSQKYESKEIYLNEDESEKKYSWDAYLELSSMA